MREAGYDCDTFLRTVFSRKRRRRMAGRRQRENMEIFPLMGEKAKDWAGRMFSRGRSMIFIGLRASLSAPLHPG